MARPVTASGFLIVEFAGLLSNSGTEATEDKPGAARDQLNLTCLRPGELQVRKGLRPVSYDPDAEGPEPHAPGTFTSYLPVL